MNKLTLSGFIFKTLNNEQYCSLFVIFFSMPRIIRIVIQGVNMHLNDIFCSIGGKPDVYKMLREKEKQAGMLPAKINRPHDIIDYYKEEMSVIMPSVAGPLSRQINNLLYDLETRRKSVEQRTLDEADCIKLSLEYARYIEDKLNIDFEYIAREEIRDLADIAKLQTLAAGAYVTTENELYGKGVEGKTEYLKDIFQTWLRSVCTAYVENNYNQTLDPTPIPFPYHNPDAPEIIPENGTVQFGGVYKRC